MKILHIGKFYPPSHGGIETVLASLAEGLVSHCEKVTVLCAQHEQQGASRSELKNGVNLIRLKSWGTWFSQPVCPELGAILKREMESHDLIHLHSPNPMAELLTTMLAPTKPVVLTYHSDIVRQKNLASLYYPLFKRFLFYCDQILVASQKYAQTSPVLSDPSLHLFSKIKVIPFGIPSPSYSATPMPSLPCFLFVGRMVGYKGVDILLHAALKLSKIADFKLILVGEGPERQNWMALAQNLGLHDSIVTFKGRVDDPATLEALFAQSTAVVLPSISRAEAFGMVQLEAMAAGRPMIVSNLPTGVTEIHKEGKTALFFEPGNASQLCEAMLKMIQTPQLSQTMGAASRMHFEANFKINKMIQSHLDVYRDLIP